MTSALRENRRRAKFAPAENLPAALGDGLGVYSDEANFAAPRLGGSAVAGQFKIRRIHHYGDRCCARRGMFRRRAQCAYA
jgi:hypothetical protein